MTTTELTLAEQQAAGLRALADVIEANPDLATRFTRDTIHMTIHTRGEDEAAELAEWARLAKAHGASVSKDIGELMYNVVATFAGSVKVAMLAYRDQVCERVVTGTETVTEEVPDPEALAAVPTVTVTREVEQVEWVCRPLLANDAPAAVA